MHKVLEVDQSSTKVRLVIINLLISRSFCNPINNLCFSVQENEDESDGIYSVSPGSNRANSSTGQTFLEMLSSGPSRSPSPVRALILDQEDSNNPVPTNWGFQHRPTTVSTDQSLTIMIFFS